MRPRTTRFVVMCFPRARADQQVRRLWEREVGAAAVTRREKNVTRTRTRTQKKKKQRKKNVYFNIIFLFHPFTTMHVPPYPNIHAHTVVSLCCYYHFWQLATWCGRGDVRRRRAIVRGYAPAAVRSARARGSWKANGEEDGSGRRLAGALE